jgi:sirohydrochlorin ferrochelatase
MTRHRPTFDRAGGILILGHGTTDSHGRAAFLAAASRIRGLLGSRPAEAGFLELAEPSAIEAGGRLVARGATDVTILPLLLFAAGHARRDLPRLVEQLSLAHPGVRFEVAPVLRFQRDLLALSALRFEEATAGSNTSGSRELAADRTHLILVGRGSSDPQATADMHEFARLRRSSTPVGEVTTAFLAVARPTLDEALELVRSSSLPRVVVQPHLLFPGQLAKSVTAAVARMRLVAPEKKWISAEPLGDHALLAAAALESAGLAGQTVLSPAKAVAGRLQVRDEAARPVLVREADLASPPANG